ncbi:MAG: DUF1736 domain-containing protein [Phycisphaeraceae bacterium]|nr:DUF1736 domain-containing protein [Phycisphaeraceae bacterium]
MNAADGQSARPGHSLARWGPWLVALAGLLAFANVTGVEQFVHDSGVIIADNPRVSGDRPAWEHFTTSYWGPGHPAGLYRPLTTLSFRLQWHMLGFGDQPWLYAVVNLLLHLGASLLVWHLARRWGADSLGATLGAGLFAVHPIATSVVGNLVGHADLLATLFGLAALVAWDRYTRDRVFYWAQAATAAWLLALLSKENAVIIPIVALVADGLLHRHRLPTGPLTWIRSRGPGLLLVGGVGLAWLAGRTFVLGRLGVEVPVAINNPLVVVESTAARLMTATHVLSRYLARSAWPATLSPDYGFNAIPVISTATNARFWAVALALAVAIAGSIVPLKKRPLITLGAAFWLLALLPVSNLGATIGTLMADRLLYLPLAGGALLAAGALTSLRPRWRVPVSIFIAVLILAGMTRSHVRNRAWHTHRALWTAAAEDVPDSVLNQYNLADTLLREGSDADDRRRALAAGDRAVALARKFDGPPPLMAWVNAGAVRIRQAQALATGPKANPAAARAMAQSALDLLRDGVQRYERAVNRGEMPLPEVGLTRQAVMLYQNLSVSAYHSGEAELAVTAARRAHHLDPGNPVLAYWLGSMLLETNRPHLALRPLQQAMAADPEHVPRRLTLTWALVETGQTATAIRRLEASPVAHHPKVRRRLAELYVQHIRKLIETGDLATAREFTARADRLKLIPRDQLETLFPPEDPSPTADTDPPPSAPDGEN